MKKTVYALLLLCPISLPGQQPAQEHVFNFGLSAGVEMQTLNLQPQPRQAGLPYVGAPTPTGGGVSAGIWGAWSVLPALTIRPGLHVSYLANTIRFETPDGQGRRDQYRFVDLELPLHFVLSRPLERLPAEALILFGGRLSWNFLAPQPDAAMRFLPERLGIDIGIGAGFELGGSRLQPEIVYSYGLTNSHDFQNMPYDRAVGRALRDRISLRLVFIP